MNDANIVSYSIHMLQIQEHTFTEQNTELTCSRVRISSTNCPAYWQENSLLIKVLMLTCEIIRQSLYVRTDLPWASLVPLEVLGLLNCHGNPMQLVLVSFCCHLPPHRTLNLLAPPAFGPRPPTVQPFETGKQFADNKTIIVCMCVWMDPPEPLYKEKASTYCCTYSLTKRVLLHAHFRKAHGKTDHTQYIPYLFEWTPRLLLISSPERRGCLFEGGYYSRASLLINSMYPGSRSVGMLRGIVKNLQLKRCVERSLLLCSSHLSANQHNIHQYLLSWL